MEFHYSSTNWQKLSKDDLYAILRLRQEIFIVEQTCPYLDADGKDQLSHHVMMKSGNQLKGYTRLLPIGISYPHYASIGRVILDLSQRGSGLGYHLMEYSIAQCNALWPSTPIKISAQEHLQQFYSKCGFTRVGQSYLEDDIPHVGMVMKSKN